MNGTRTLSFGEFTIEAPQAWGRILDSWGNVADQDRPPYSLVRQQDGIGVLQFSPALHKGGPEPDVTSTLLLKMGEDFGKLRELGESFEQAVFDDDALAIGALSFRPKEKFIRLWFASDGRNFLFITYGSEWGRQDAELPDCEAMARSARFVMPPTT